MPGEKAILCCFVVFMLLSVLHNPTLFAGGSAENSIAIVYNNVPGDMSSGVKVGGGFSAFIVFNQKEILFDTGGDTAILINNIRALGLNLEHLDAAVISHNHWDHVYGLPGIHALTGVTPKVYVPGSSKDSVLQQNPHLDVVPIQEPMEIMPSVWSTGEVKTSYRDIALLEQSLILDGGEGLYVITGCAHPGVVEIIERVKEILPERPIALVTGGFHLVNATEEEVRGISAKLKELGVKNIAPSHCTGSMAMDIFREEWGDRHVELYLGHVHKF
ncbi:MAG: MBL fold metallo-hydrolase [candidate division WOR-3 bacterium]|nr:MBL fold metallo-hydrolase [candidate division WOR-3 bacterium]